MTFLSYSSEEGDRFKCLDSALMTRGLEGAVAIGNLLLKEKNSEKRDWEIEIIRSLDRSPLRLRDTAQGREVIAIVRDAIATKKLFYYESDTERAAYLKQVESGFRSDH